METLLIPVYYKNFPVRNGILFSQTKSQGFRKPKQCFKYRMTAEPPVKIYSSELDGKKF